MKTLIFDIDGTITNMWPIEKLVLLRMLDKASGIDIENIYQSGIKDTYIIFSKIYKPRIGKTRYRKLYNRTFSLLESKKLLPKPIKYPLVRWIKKYKTFYRFVYATGGQKKETDYVLRSLRLNTIFDYKNSINKSFYPFSKITGLPFKKIKNRSPDCFLITDNESDCLGAKLAGIGFLKVKSNQLISFEEKNIFT